MTHLRIASPAPFAGIAEVSVWRGVEIGLGGICQLPLAYSTKPSRTRSIA